MRLLLDTHIVVWAYGGDTSLKPDTLALLKDREHTLFVSIASIWEISIKQAIGKLRLPDNLIQLLDLNSIQVLPITVDHAYAVRSLPNLHGDPFDRMLVTQAMLDDLTLMTHDRRLAEYNVAVLLV